MTKILVIDDEPSIINLVSAYLKPEALKSTPPQMATPDSNPRAPSNQI